MVTKANPIETIYKIINNNNFYNKILTLFNKYNKEYYKILIIINKNILKVRIFYFIHPLQ